MAAVALAACVATRAPSECTERPVAPAANVRRAPDAEDALIRVGGRTKPPSLLELLSLVADETGAELVFDDACRRRLEETTVFVCGAADVRRSDLLEWLVAVLSFCDLVLVPLETEPPDARRRWRIEGRATAVRPARRARPEASDAIVPRFSAPASAPPARTFRRAPPRRRRTFVVHVSRPSKPMEARRMRRSVVPSLVPVLLLAACATTYDTGYRFDPKPTSAPLGDAGRVEATALGVRETTAEGTPAVDVRVRVERFGAEAVRLDAGALRLVTRDRGTIAPTDVRARGPAVPATGGASSFDATFALPCRDASGVDLERFDVVVPVDVGGRAREVTLRLCRDATCYRWANPWDWGRNDPAGRATGWSQ